MAHPGVEPPAPQDLPANPFTYAVELVRFAFYGQIDWLSLAVVAGFTVLFLAGAIIAYDPSRGSDESQTGHGRKR